MGSFEFILLIVALLVLVLSINLIYEREKRTTARFKGLLASASRARQLEMVSLPRRLEAYGQAAGFAVRVKIALDVDCEDHYLVNRTGIDVRVSICVSGAMQQISIEWLREKVADLDGNRVLMGDAYLDAIVDIRVHDTTVRARLMERKETLSQSLFALLKLPKVGEKWLQVRDGTVESRLRQSATNWTLRQLLGLIDATVAIAKVISVDAPSPAM